MSITCAGCHSPLRADDVRCPWCHSCDREITATDTFTITEAVKLSGRHGEPATVAPYLTATIKLEYARERGPLTATSAPTWRSTGTRKPGSWSFTRRPR